MYSAVLKLMHQHHTWTGIMRKSIILILFAIQISFRLDVFCYSCKVSILQGHIHELSTVTKRNIDTRCIAICIAIQVFYIAMYRNTLFGVSLHPYSQDSTLLQTRADPDQAALVRAA